MVRRRRTGGGECNRELRAGTLHGGQTPRRRYDMRWFVALFKRIKPELAEYSDWI